MMGPPVLSIGPLIVAGCEERVLVLVPAGPNVLVATPAPDDVGMIGPIVLSMGPLVVAEFWGLVCEAIPVSVLVAELSVDDPS